LRSHPVAFLREELRQRRIVSCTEAMEARDGRRLESQIAWPALSFPALAGPLNAW